MAQVLNKLNQIAGRELQIIGSTIRNGTEYVDQSSIKRHSYLLDDRYFEIKKQESIEKKLVKSRPET